MGTIALGGLGSAFLLSDSYSQISLTNLPINDQPYALSGVVDEHAQTLNLTPLGEELLLASEPEIIGNPGFDEACSGVDAEPGVGVLGCYYTGRDKIYVYDVTDPRLLGIEPVVLAHELLHAGWERLTDSEKIELNQELTETFTNLPAGHPVVVRLLPYLESDPESLPTELHSIMGTEAVELPESLEAHYAKYFRNRSQVAQEANNAYGVIDDVRVEVTTLAEQLISGEVELDKERKRLNQREIELGIAIQEFNDLADSGAFVSETEYNRVRSVLEEEQVSLSDDYKTFNIAVEQYNSDVSRLEELNKTLQELNEGINIPDRQ